MDKLKAEIKQWEQQFKEVYGRNPEKQDIKADSEINAKYKKYWHMRKRDSRVPRKKQTEVCHPRHGGSAESDTEYEPETPQKQRIVMAIGPTPQMNGRVVGLFDTLLPSKKIRLIHQSPSTQTPVKLRVPETPESAKTPRYLEGIFENTKIKRKNRYDPSGVDMENEADEDDDGLSEDDDDDEDLAIISPLKKKAYSRPMASVLAELRDIREEIKLIYQNEDSIDDEQKEDQQTDSEELAQQEEKQQPRYIKKGQKRTTRKVVLRPVVDHDDETGEPDKGKGTTGRKHKPTANFQKIKLKNSGYKTNLSKFRRWKK